MSDKPVGPTKDVGYQIGVSRTVGAPLDRVWQRLTSPAGVACWLGAGATLPARVGEAYQTYDGTIGELRSRRTGDRIRATWRPPGWTHDTTVQVTVSAASGDRCVLRLHQEWLADADERDVQREHWKDVMGQLEAIIGSA